MKKALNLTSAPLSSYLSYKEDIDSAISRVLNSGWYILGKETSAFENEFSEYIGARYGIGVGSGTEALHLSLLACGIGPGDEVITVAHTAVATAAAIELCGARPVFADIDPGRFTIAPELIEDLITDKTKAILPVHLYGHPADMNEIMRIARCHGLFVIEDCAQSHGAAIGERKTGTWGDIAAFSFYPTKNLGAIGDGGIIVTNSPKLAEKVKLLREYGWKQRYISEMPGLNSRLDELQSAILRAKLPHLDEENVRRKKLAEIYNEVLDHEKILVPHEIGNITHVYHQYVIRVRKRDGLRSYLKELGIDTLIHYPVPIHLQPAYHNDLNSKSGLLETEKACQEILSLPIHPQLTDTQIVQISGFINDFVKTGE